LIRAAKVARPAIEAAAKRREEQRQRSAPRQKSWVPKSDSATVAGRDIGGMIYVGTPPALNNYGYGYRDKCRAYIDPSLSVAAVGNDKSGDGMPYWPGYSDISRQCRATYLDWLASGRSDASYNPGYMFLYFYGLERRFVLDQPPDAEKREILEEVQRLARLYPDSGSVQRYLGEFIQIAQIAVNDSAVHEPVFDHHGWDLPFSLKLGLGARVGRGELLSADWVLSWLLCHPERRMRTPATRCSEEFRALFRLRFGGRFPDGLKVAKPRKTLSGSYQAASSEFRAELSPLVDGKPVLDISGLRKPIEIAQEIADEAMDDLDKFSRYLGRNSDGRGSLEAQALLPSELWPLFPSEELDRLKDWARSIVESGGVVPVVDVVVRLEGARPDKLTKRQLTGAADALARIGYGLAPDPRFALRAPKIGEPAVIFDLGDAVEQLEDVSDAYRAALTELALGTFVAHADNHIADAERRVLSERIETADGVSAQERKRLFANLDWLLAVPPDLSLLRKKVKDTGPDAQVALRTALAAMAHADGMVQSEEVSGIEKIYKALGLDPGLVYSDIHAGSVPDAPIRVRTAKPGTAGEAIPAETSASGPTLDAARIAAIRSDTERVSSVLGEIFAGDEEAEASHETVALSVLKGLDQPHAALVREVVGQEHWTDVAFTELCARHGLMAAGALEAVNEWAFDTYDEALLDEYDGFDVAPEIAVALKGEFDKEGPHVQTETS